MIPRTLYNQEHEMFRDAARRFIDGEIVPHHARWEEQGHVDRNVWNKAGESGMLCTSMPEQYGGAGVDLLYSAVYMEEQARVGATGVGFFLHSEIVAPYILHHGSDYLKSTYLPKMASGEMIGAIAMTEPGAGSDLQGIKTSAVRDGDDYILNGSKTFITNGWLCDLVIVVAKTDPTAGSKGISLFVVDTTMPGFSKGKRLHKMGMSAQDTSELFFDNVRVPARNLLGEEGRGFYYLMKELPWERLQIAVTGIAAAQAALDWTIAYTKERKAFGKSIGDFQTVAHKLAEMKTEIAVGQVFVDRCLELMAAGKLDAETASMAKYNISDLQFSVMDRCVQLFGGYGYMHEYPIARAWADARVQRIYGGTNEIMKELISRTL
ncbi:acyl-CoA dehydrogenase family protein [Rugamonas apoptosis]|uniref:Acyl-CoA dehydrogenase family protein n=1 Tax=Rugamonas apoptosis TaxID=2758570 RepID=A0A7W2FA68_9BURK|nr:acyl-CoA dehydrogenase family protein [Rugamonas apoptosis]MBA5687869.1 acyl-CoA dehydrogenase family protein [Rugamonas apoptosis]